MAFFLAVNHPAFTLADVLFWLKSSVNTKEHFTFLRSVIYLSIAHTTLTLDQDQTTEILDHFH